MLMRKPQRKNNSPSASSSFPAVPAALGSRGNTPSAHDNFKVGVILSGKLDVSDSKKSLEAPVSPAVLKLESS